MFLHQKRYLLRKMFKLQELLNILCWLLATDNSQLATEASKWISVKNKTAIWCKGPAEDG